MYILARQIKSVILPVQTGSAPAAAALKVGLLSDHLHRESSVISMSTVIRLSRSKSRLSRVVPI